MKICQEVILVHLNSIIGDFPGVISKSKGDFSGGQCDNQDFVGGLKVMLLCVVFTLLLSYIMVTSICWFRYRHLLIIGSVGDTDDNDYGDDGDDYGDIDEEEDDEFMMMLMKTSLVLVSHF